MSSGLFRIKDTATATVRVAVAAHIKDAASVRIEDAASIRLEDAALIRVEDAVGTDCGPVLVRRRHERISPRFRQALTVAAAALLIKTFAATLWNYQNYFPLNFDAAFLIGRQLDFATIYRPVFYVHIVSSPMALALMASIWLSMRRGFVGCTWVRRHHRLMGRMTAAWVCLIVAPSGLAMAFWAAAGPVAALGFAAQAILTFAAITAAVWAAANARMALHRRLIDHAMLLMVAPLVLRIYGGLTEVLSVSDPTFYTVNAWLPWLVPMSIYEAARQLRRETLIPSGVNA